MITQKMTAKEARDNFTDLLGSVYYGKQSVVVEKKGRPFAVVVSPDEYKNYIEYKKAAKKRISEIIEEIQAANEQVLSSWNKDKNHEQTFKDITETVEEIRQERYAKRQKTKSGS
ncbi:hypothetical protein A3I48_03960 [Candidatus Daviesbacteria bacterium RIFCSPLOWO2_02_FULL_36_7]|uniref:Antitoxin n=1 Tax=Candidatus Daviesbacteria bacterium RIFCSPLOWO2_02_FULL_36_7 TaxID=1797792 RepID=A0A1F5MI18_9BACT|nr:MAG: hypothetical protein A3I48_03960 [Candidatus Daviesbacteria bacterium RIFCSPLOWO2_02_FULL_36_7]